MDKGDRSQAVRSYADVTREDVKTYLASVTTAEELWKHRIRFIGVIKTATWKFMITYLSNMDFQK